MTHNNPPTYNPIKYSIKGRNIDAIKGRSIDSPKRTLKNRVKSFFNVDIEKDLQEEESTKKFKDVKLFTLSRKNLFIGLFLFLLVVNILVGFDLNFIYLRQILGFLFLILVPGVLIMLCFRISVNFWEYLVYTIGLSVAFIMFAGLIVNWTLPLLNITDKPLSLYPILICFDIFLIILGIVAWKRNKGFLHEVTVPKLDRLNNIFFIIPMFFPVLAILGAFLLNNHGPNILTMIMLGSIAVYVLLLVIFRKHLNENIWPWTILMISISILLSWWLRSWFISGVDSNLEYFVFQITKQKLFWSINNYRNAYNAMLSLTILPTILSNILKINDQFIFKLIFQIIFSFVPLIMLLVFRKFIKNNTLIFLGALFFIIQPYFIAIQMRQAIAFIFFSLLFLILLENDLRLSIHKLFFIVFGISMIVSHYSTSYIALALLLLINSVNILYKRWKK